MEQGKSMAEWKESIRLEKMKAESKKQADNKNISKEKDGKNK